MGTEVKEPSRRDHILASLERLRPILTQAQEHKYYLINLRNLLPIEPKNRLGVAFEYGNEEHRGKIRARNEALMKKENTEPEVQEFYAQLFKLFDLEATTVIYEYETGLISPGDVKEGKWSWSMESFRIARDPEKQWRDRYMLSNEFYEADRAGLQYVTEPEWVTTEDGVQAFFTFETHCWDTWVKLRQQSPGKYERKRLPAPPKDTEETPELTASKVRFAPLVDVFMEEPLTPEPDSPQEGAEIPEELAT